MVSGQRHETTQRRSATAIHIPVALCDAPGVKTKILSTKKGPGCKHRSRSHGESGEVFLLDTLSHRMSDMAMFLQLGDANQSMNKIKLAQYQFGFHRRVSRDNAAVFALRGLHRSDVCSPL